MKSYIIDFSILSNLRWCNIFLDTNNIIIVIYCIQLLVITHFYKALCLVAYNTDIQSMQCCKYNQLTVSSDMWPVKQLNVALPPTWARTSVLLIALPTLSSSLPSIDKGLSSFKPLAHRSKLSLSVKEGKKFLIAAWFTTRNFDASDLLSLSFTLREEWHSPSAMKLEYINNVHCSSLSFRIHYSRIVELYTSNLCKLSLSDSFNDIKWTSYLILIRNYCCFSTKKYHR